MDEFADEGKARTRADHRPLWPVVLAMVNVPPPILTSRLVL